MKEPTTKCGCHLSQNLHTALVSEYNKLLYRAALAGDMTLFIPKVHISVLALLGGKGEKMCVHVTGDWLAGHLADLATYVAHACTCRHSHLTSSHNILARSLLNIACSRAEQSGKDVLSGAALTGEEVSAAESDPQTRWPLISFTCCLPPLRRSD